MIVRRTGVLPNALLLNGVVKTSEHPVSGGGFADIYTGMLDGTKVALKVLRVYGTNEIQKRAFGVCNRSFSLGYVRLTINGGKLIGGSSRGDVLEGLRPSPHSTVHGDFPGFYTPTSMLGFPVDAEWEHQDLL